MENTPRILKKLNKKESIIPLMYLTAIHHSQECLGISGYKLSIICYIYEKNKQLNYWGFCDHDPLDLPTPCWDVE